MDEIESTMPALVAEGRSLGPWHMNVRIKSSLWTRAFAGDEWVCDLTDGFTNYLRTIFPNGLEGRSVLDMACNCGAHLFVAKDFGAGKCLGVDVREHWIRQAEFLLEHRGDENMDFRVADLRTLSPETIGQFDVVFFRGVLYHLLDPIEALRGAADLARETLIVSTQTREGEGDALIAFEESPENLLNGIGRLAWAPTGPSVVMRLLQQFGLDARCLLWWTPPNAAEGIHVAEVVGSRVPYAEETFENRLARTIYTYTPPGSKILLDGGMVQVLNREVLPYREGEDCDYVVVAEPALHTHSPKPPHIGDEHRFSFVYRP